MTSIHSVSTGSTYPSRSPNNCKKRTLEDVGIQPQPNPASSQIQWDPKTVVYAPVGQFGKNWILQQEDGQHWSFYLQNAQHYMAHTESLQSAMTHLQQNGYQTLSSEYLEQCDSNFNHHQNRITQYPVQTPGRQLQAFHKKDNNNPKKPRYVLTIGENETSRDLFQSFTQVARQNYAIPVENTHHVDQINRKAIEKGVKQLATLAKNSPEAEFMIVYAGESSIPKGQRKDTTQPEGSADFLMYRSPVNGNFGTPVREKELIQMIKTHLPNRPIAFIAEGCRSGALIAQ